MERIPTGPGPRVARRRARPRAVVATLVLAAVWTAAPPTSAPPAGADDSDTVAAAAAPTVDAATTAAPEPAAPAATTTTTLPAPEEEPVAASPSPTAPAETAVGQAAPPAVASTDAGVPSTAEARIAPAPELLVTAADTVVTITPASPTATYGAVVPDLSVVASVQGIPADDPQLDTLDCTAAGLVIREGRIDSPAGTYPLTCTVDAVDGRTVTFRPAALTVRANTALLLSFGAGYQCAEGNFQPIRGSLCLDAVGFSVDINRRNSPEPPEPTRIQVAASLRPLDGGPEIAIPITEPLRLGRRISEVLIPFSVPPGRYGYRLEVIGNGYWEPRVLVDEQVFVQRVRRVEVTPASPTARTGDPVPDLSVVASVTGDTPDPGQLEALACTADGLEVTDGRITSPPGRYPLSCSIPRGLRQDLTILPAALTVEPVPTTTTTTTTTVAPTTAPPTTAAPTTEPPTTAPLTTATPPAPTVEAAAVTGSTGGSASPSTTVRATGLAFTGGDLGVLGTVAAALVLAGGLLLLARRRRTD